MSARLPLKLEEASCDPSMSKSNTLKHVAEKLCSTKYRTQQLSQCRPCLSSLCFWLSVPPWHSPTLVQARCARLTSATPLVDPSTAATGTTARTPSNKRPACVPFQRATGPFVRCNMHSFRDAWPPRSWQYGSLIIPACVHAC